MSLSPYQYADGERLPAVGNGAAWVLTNPGIRKPRPGEAPGAVVYERIWRRSLVSWTAETMKLLGWLFGRQPTEEQHSPVPKLSIQQGVVAPSSLADFIEIPSRNFQGECVRSRTGATPSPGGMEMIRVRLAHAAGPNTADTNC